MHYKRRQFNRAPIQRNRTPSYVRSRSRCSTPISNLPPIKRTSSTNNRAADSARQQARRQRKRQFAQRRRTEARKLHQEEKAAIQKRWTRIAIDTERIVRGTGQYVEDDVIPASTTNCNIGEPSLSSFSQVVHDISPQVELSRQLTSFYPHYSDSLANWRLPPLSVGSSKTAIEFTSTSTLNAAYNISVHYPHLITPASSSNLPSTKVGVLCFASSKKPKGGGSHGGEEQLDLIIRSSSLIASLLDSSAGEMFYEEHRRYWREDGSGLHDHGMLYSPGVVVFRKEGDDNVTKNEDEDFDHVVSLSSRFAGADVVTRRQSTGESTGTSGAFISPYTVNVLAAVPVSAGVVRSKHFIPVEDKQLFEDGIRSAMKERMARILKLFEERGDRVIVLGAFGCGCSSQNAVETVASVWAELLFCGDREPGTGKAEARFKDVFEKVVFAVPGKLFAPFKDAFEMRVFEEEVVSATIDD